MSGHPLSLPKCPPPTFTWGSLEAQSFTSAISRAYEQVVHWRLNLFLVPFGTAGSHFVRELARLYQAFAEGLALECIALRAATVFTILALQKPYQKSKAKIHSLYLKRCLESWCRGDIEELLTEGQTIQRRSFRGQRRQTTQASATLPELARSFSKLMFQGKCGAALTLLAERKTAGVLKEDDVLPSGESVYDALKSKHPSAQGLNVGGLSIPEDMPPLPSPVMFECIDADLIRLAAKHTKGAAGPSGLDAHGWRRICCTFKEASDELCHSLALLARRICTRVVHHSALAPLLACRLIALDKNPGVRPIGICEVPRRIVSKAILYVIKSDIQEAAGSNQLCGGQVAGIEAAVHAVRQSFNSEDMEGILLVDACNAFNSLNRANALANIRSLCPPFSTVLTNIYSKSSELFLGRDTLLSQEGTTQGDPLAMPFYALATRPLIDALTSSVPKVKQVWYADDASATGKMSDLREWWEKLSTIGPSFGYFVNPSKTWLVCHVCMASELFSDSSVNITVEGRPVLGSPVGTPDYISGFVSQKVQEWVEEVETLAEIAESQPHAAYSAVTHGLSSKWNHLSRTTPEIQDLLQPLEDAIKMKLLPKLCGKVAPNDLERSLFSLPARSGGLNINNSAAFSTTQYEDSLKVTKPLVCLILAQSENYNYDVLSEQITAKKDIKARRRQLSDEAAKQIRDAASPTLQHAIDLAMEKGASSWLTVLPLEEHCFALHKQAFRDALALRYGWLPSQVPSHCPCGQSFSIQHMMSCPKGGYPSIRHNELRDLTASLLTETCHGVAVEPPLQPITSEVLNRATSNNQDGARLDIVANGFWGSTFERAFFDVRVFNPYAPSNRHSPPWQLPTDSTKTSRSVTTSNECAKSNMPPSLHWYSQQPVVSALQHPPSTNV